MLRSLIVIAVATAGCRTATEKQCDALFDRHERCSGTQLTATMTSAAHAACYVSLGRELKEGDTTSFAAVQRAALLECSALQDCGALTACFAKHACTWVFATPGAEPFFACSQ